MGVLQRRLYLGGKGGHSSSWEKGLLWERRPSAQGKEESKLGATSAVSTPNPSPTCSCLYNLFPSAASSLFSPDQSSWSKWGVKG